jgi:hypothetical protein
MHLSRRACTRASGRCERKHRQAEFDGPTMMPETGRSAPVDSEALRYRLFGSFWRAGNVADGPGPMLSTRPARRSSTMASPMLALWDRSTTPHVHARAIGRGSKRSDAMAKRLQVGRILSVYEGQAPVPAGPPATSLAFLHRAGGRWCTRPSKARRHAERSSGPPRASGRCCNPTELTGRTWLRTIGLLDRFCVQSFGRG